MILTRFSHFGLWWPHMIWPPYITLIIYSLLGTYMPSMRSIHVCPSNLKYFHFIERPLETSKDFYPHQLCQRSCTLSTAPTCYAWDWYMFFLVYNAFTIWTLIALNDPRVRPAIIYHMREIQLFSMKLTYVVLSICCTLVTPIWPWLSLSDLSRPQKH